VLKLSLHAEYFLSLLQVQLGCFTQFNPESMLIREPANCNGHKCGKDQQSARANLRFPRHSRNSTAHEITGHEGTIRQSLLHSYMPQATADPCGFSGEARLR
jgi:hypothetical protein